MIRGVLSGAFGQLKTCACEGWEMLKGKVVGLTTGLGETAKLAVTALMAGFKGLLEKALDTPFSEWWDKIKDVAVAMIWPWPQVAETFKGMLRTAGGAVLSFVKGSPNAVKCVVTADAVRGYDVEVP